MNQIKAAVTGIIPAPPKKVYAILSDYHAGHPAILPRPYFQALKVLEGGIGAGTQIEVNMNVFGVEQTSQMIVSEPEPGHILVEEDKLQGIKTTFTIDPANEGAAARVTIHTAASAAPGLRGVMERLFNPMIMRHIYRKELDQLINYVLSQSGG